MPEEKLVFFFIPSLVAILLNRERAKGHPLTEQEVLEIRDGAVTIALTPEAAADAEKSRGYRDIDPENVWEEWQRARLNPP